MRERRCTIDSSCVIALDHLELVPQLSLLFSTVLVPKAVRQDLFKRRATKDRVQSFFGAYAFFQRCDDYDQGTVDFLLAERTRQGARDRGEVEAVVQASQFGAVVIVDDPWGRNSPRVTIWSFMERYGFLKRFHELELISGTALRDCVVSLRGRGIRLPWETVKAGRTASVIAAVIAAPPTKHGNVLAFIIDRPIPHLLKIDPDTPLHVSTNGKQSIVAPPSPHDGSRISRQPRNWRASVTARRSANSPSELLQRRFAEPIISNASRISQFPVSPSIATPARNEPAEHAAKSPRNRSVVMSRLDLRSEHLMRMRAASNCGNRDKRNKTGSASLT